MVPAPCAIARGDDIEYVAVSFVCLGDGGSCGCPLPSSLRKQGPLTTDVMLDICWHSSRSNPRAFVVMGPRARAQLRARRGRLVVAVSYRVCFGGWRRRSLAGW